MLPTALFSPTRCNAPFLGSPSTHLFTWVWAWSESEWVRRGLFDTLSSAARCCFATSSSFLYTTPTYTTSFLYTANYYLVLENEAERPFKGRCHLTVHNVICIAVWYCLLCSKLATLPSDIEWLSQEAVYSTKEDVGHAKLATLGVIFSHIWSYIFPNIGICIFPSIGICIFSTIGSYIFSHWELYFPSQSHSFNFFSKGVGKTLQEWKTGLTSQYHKISFFVVFLSSCIFSAVGAVRIENWKK